MKPTKWAAASTTVTAALIAALTVAAPAQADVAIWVHGAVLSDALTITPDVMRRIPPGYSVDQLRYAAGLWPWTGPTSATGAQSIADGVPRLDALIHSVQGQGQILVIGESLGSMVVDQELRRLANDPNAPDPAQLRFEVIADPTRPGGIFSYQPDGTFTPLTGGPVQSPPETAYDVTVIKLQYDGIASWPDRPWHLLADLNAVAGALVYHGTDHYGYAAQQVLSNQVPAENITTRVNSKGGVTTTYTVQQTPALVHLLEPLFPNAVAAVDKVLTPLINLGYSELTPDAGVHLAPGGGLANRDGRPVAGTGHPSTRTPAAKTAARSVRPAPPRRATAAHGATGRARARSAR